MAYVDSLISTGVDQLINLVYREKRVSLENAARELGIARKVIEEWARILEEEGIVRIEYQFTSTYLAWAGESIAEPEKLKGLREQRDSLLNEIEGLTGKVESYIKESRESAKKFATLMKEVSSVSEGIRTAVDMITDLKKESKKADEEASAMIAEIESLMNGINAKIGDYEKRLSDAEKSYNSDSKLADTIKGDYADLLAEVRKHTETFSKHKKLIDDALSDLTKMEAGITERLNTYSQLSEGTLQDEIKNAYDKFESIKATYSSLNETMEKRLAEMRLALKTITDFSKDIDTLEEKISEDVIAARYAEIRKMMDLMSELEDEEERLDKKLKLVANELRSLKIEVPPSASTEVEKKLEEAKDKIKATKREATLIEQKRQELLNLMKRIKESKKE